METKHPCYRIRIVNGQEIRECISAGDPMDYGGFSVKRLLEELGTNTTAPANPEVEIGAG